MDQVIVSIAGGALLGATFALVGLGLVLAFRATATLSFVQGQLMLLAAFVVAYFTDVKHMPFVAAAVLALVICMLISAVFYFTVLQRITGLPLFVGFVATLGLAGILNGLMPLAFGSDSHSITIPGLPSGSFSVGNTMISRASVILAAISLVIALGVAAFLRFTRFGVAVRASGQDALLASQSGIRVRRLHLLSWAAAGLLAAIAGIVYGSQTIVNTSLVDVALAAFPAILLGGLDSIEGAVVGGLIIGMIQGFTSSYLGGEYVNLVSYVVLLVAMLIRPQGLFGTVSVLRA